MYSQLHTMTAIELRDILQQDLGTLIGTYTTPSGKVYPAIRIYPPRVDTSWVISGVEVAIYEIPDSSGTIPLIGEKLSIDWWIVKLVQWDSTKGLSEIIDRIESFFPKVKTTSKTATIENFQTAIMYIYDPKFLGYSRCYK